MVGCEIRNCRRSAPSNINHIVLYYYNVLGLIILGGQTTYQHSYCRDVWRVLERGADQGGAGWMTSETGPDYHLWTVPGGRRTERVGESCCRCLWSPTLRNEEGRHHHHTCTTQLSQWLNGKRPS